MALTAQEIRILEKIAGSLDDINSSIKALNDTIKKTNNNTNKNTMTYKLVEGLHKIEGAIKSSTEKISDSVAKS